MRGRSCAVAGLMTLVVCGLIAVVQRRGPAAWRHGRTALASACTSVGSAAKQALSSGSEDVKQALSQAESSCKSAVSQLPSGQAQDALSKLCDSIASAE